MEGEHMEWRKEWNRNFMIGDINEYSNEIKQHQMNTTQPARPLIIGISGKKESGKDTVADILTGLFFYKNKRGSYKHPFAHALKEEVRKALEISVDELDNNKVKYRPILQWWGTDFRRTQDSEYWVKKLAEGLYGFIPEHVIIIPDVRFVNEAKFIKDRGGLLWRVTKGWNAITDDLHLSEVSLDNYNSWDAIIGNTGTKEELQKVVEAQFDKLFETRTVKPKSDLERRLDNIDKEVKAIRNDYNL